MMRNAFNQLLMNSLGHYEVSHWHEGTKSFNTDTSVSLFITVDQVSDNHRIVSQKGDTKSRFTFTAHDSGEHKICFQPVGEKAHNGYLKNGQEVGGVKVNIDMAIGETSNIETTDSGKIQDLVARVRDLNGRLQDIRREQVFQRVRSSSALVMWYTNICQEREAEFRDQSEATNARAVRWTLIQMVVLGCTCAWQLSHLRAFFIKQKLT